MLLFEIIKKIGFSITSDRIGPDMFFSHWKLNFKSTMIKLCIKKFKSFKRSADFRPGAYAISCSNISIGENVVIRPTTMLFADVFGEINIKDNVMIGAGVHFYVNNHKFNNPNIPIIEQGYYPSKSIIVNEGSWIGANTIILPGVTIGTNSVVGAGSVVTKSIPSGTVFAGNPAKFIKEIGALSS